MPKGFEAPWCLTESSVVTGRFDGGIYKELETRFRKQTVHGTELTIRSGRQALQDDSDP